jgi:hypothetical protein
MGDDSEDNEGLLDIGRSLSAQMRERHVAPAADAYDPDRFPYGVAAGGNKMGLKVCAVCGKPPTQIPRNEAPLAFLFTTELSAREYRISGICQDCQDHIFKPDDEHD